MNTQALELEIVPDELGLAPSAKMELQTAFSGYFAEAEKWKLQAESITDPKVARTARLEIKKLRVNAEKKRKSLKEESLRMGKAIDGANNILLALIVPVEKHFEDIEKEEERRLEAEREERIDYRTELLMPWLAPDSIIPPLGDLTDEQFESMLDDAMILHKAKAEAAARAEAERIERERKEAEEREAQRLENIRLKAEAEAREKAMQAEREAAEKARLEAEAAARKEREEIERKAATERAEAQAKARAEAEAREKAEREARELREAAERKAAEEKAATEAKAKAEAEAARKAAAAPDKQKAMAFADTVRAMTAPQAASPEGKRVMSEIQAKVTAFADWIEAQAATL